MKVTRQPAFFDQSQCTYFRSSDVAPTVSPDGKAVELYDGEGFSRSWGRAFVATYPLINTRTFFVCLIGYSHKHGGGQSWYYFEKSKDGSIKRRTAGQLSTRRRKQVLRAYETLAPTWAKKPFDAAEKPKRSKPQRFERFKQVAQADDGSLLSIFDGTEYELGKTRREASKPSHGGGFYVYATAEEAANAAFPDRCECADLPRVIVRCVVWGKAQVYSKGKQAWSYCQPVEVIA